MELILDLTLKTTRSSIKHRAGASMNANNNCMRVQVYVREEYCNVQDQNVYDLFVLKNRASKLCRICLLLRLSPREKRSFQSIGIEEVFLSNSIRRVSVKLKVHQCKIYFKSFERQDDIAQRILFRI